MTNRRWAILITVSLGVVFLALVISDSPDSMPPVDEFEIQAVEDPLPRGDRIFGVTVSEGIIGFGAAFTEAQSAGIEVIELNIPWDEIEIAEGAYQDPWGVLGAIAFYGENNISVGFSLGVIDTVERRTPAYLEGLDYDDPRVIQAFNEMVDWFLGNVPPNVNVISLSIGNEVDLVLRGEAWDQYARFMAETVQHMHDNFPQIVVGVKVTVMNGVLGGWVELVQFLNEVTDVVMLTYYPLAADFEVLAPEIVHEHFQHIVNAFPSRRIWLMEAGYPSGEQYNRSSWTQQAAFFHEMFTAWDNHASDIQLIIIDWLHDQSPETIEAWKEYYGSAPGLVEYLSTLGLRTYDGQDKPAWQQLLLETEARGW